MTTEEKLKDLILSKYKSILSFTQEIEMPYGTMASIFKRGIENSSVTNIIKICHALGISTDELAKGKIVPLQKSNHETDVVTILEQTKRRIMNDSLTLDGNPLTDYDVLVLTNSLMNGIEIIRQSRRATAYMKEFEESDQ